MLRTLSNVVVLCTCTLYLVHYILKYILYYNKYLSAKSPLTHAGPKF